VAALGFLARAGTTGSVSRIVTIMLAIVITAVMIQVVPLPASLVDSLSPEHDAVDYRKLFATITMRDEPPALDAGSARALSIAPSRTFLGLAFVTAYSLLLIGCVKGLGAVGTLGVVRGVVVLGLIAAFAEIFQKASGSSIVYGLFEPRQIFYQSAPFINRNHTAGWLIMATALALGHLAGSVDFGARATPSWRERILWLSSRRASEVVLTGSVIAVMGVAIVLTASRSGFLCLLLVALLFGSFSVRKQSTGWRRALTAGHLVFVLLVAMVMGGVGAVGERFAAARLESVDGRLDVWRDSFRIIGDFPIAGTGFNTYGIAMLHYQQTQHGVVRYIEAHNDYLQLAAEGGLLLGIPVIVLFVVIAREIRRRFAEGRDDKRTYWLRVGAVCGLVAIAFQSIFDFTLQMPGAAVMFILVAAIAMHRRPSSSASS
jgi:O-antigen ligase